MKSGEIRRRKFKHTIMKQSGNNSFIRPKHGSLSEAGSSIMNMSGHINNTMIHEDLNRSMMPNSHYSESKKKVLFKFISKCISALLLIAIIHFLFLNSIPFKQATHSFKIQSGPVLNLSRGYSGRSQKFNNDLPVGSASSNISAPLNGSGSNKLGFYQQFSANYENHAHSPDKNKNNKHRKLLNFDDSPMTK